MSDVKNQIWYAVIDEANQLFCVAKEDYEKGILPDRITGEYAIETEYENVDGRNFVKKYYGENVRRILKLGGGDTNE